MAEIVVRDAVSPQNLTLDQTYQAVMPYRDGEFRWSLAQVNRFVKGGKRLYPVTVLGDDPHRAQIADCERGDLTPAAAARWAHQRNQLHQDATVYASLASIPDVLDALGMEPCWLWVADWTGAEHEPRLHLPPTVRLAAVQFASNAAYDTSEIMTSVWPAHPWLPGNGAW